MEISSPSIDGKVCSGIHSKGGNANATTFGTTSSVNTETAQCSGLKDTASKKPFSKFAELDGLKESKNWPTGSYSDGSKIVTNSQNSNANAMAKDLVNLNRDEKTIVAGLLAKTIEGGEVVEIRAVSSTSVMYCQFISLYETTSHDVIVVWRFEKLLIPL
ncbi:hypothetical protein ANAPH2_00399 [Anaplasma phagocytophilum]|nr:hypothetical protein ANAPH2_00399 [Anaplasma phagocytophilum]